MDHLHQPSSSVTIGREHPICRLPFDILYRIFVILCEDAYATMLSVMREAQFTVADHTSAPPARIYPKTLTHVCQQWRSIAIESPALWTNLAFRRKPNYEEQALWIERSKSAGLNIAINCHSVGGLAQIMQLLRPHVERWKSFILFPSDSIKGRPFRMLMDDIRDAYVPMLEELDVVNRVDESQWVFQPFRGGAPKLMVLKVGCGRLDCGAPIFSGLTTLHIQPPLAGPDWNAITTSDIFLLLSQSAPTLQDFLYRDCSNSTGLAKPAFPLPIHLPNLSRFHLSTVVFSESSPSDLWVRDVYAGIRAPQIRSHTLNPIVLHHLVTSGASFPFSGLHDLSIHFTPSELDIDIPESTLISVFSHLSQLQFLSVMDVKSLDPQIFATLCPQLQWLTVGMCYVALPPRTYLMKEMVEARRQNLWSLDRSVDPLTYLHVTLVPIPEHQVTWLRKNLNEFHYDPPRQPL